MEAFVYCWTDHRTNKLYVGVHKGTEDDGYVCSSKSMMREYKKRPTDFTRQIIAHGTDVDCRSLESAILKSVDAKMNESFYNMHNNDGNFYWKGPRGPFSEEHKAKLADAKRGRKISEEHKKKLHEGRRKSKNSPEHAAAVIASRIGTKHTDEAKAKMSERKLSNPKTRINASLAGRASAAVRKKVQ